MKNDIRPRMDINEIQGEEKELSFGMTLLVAIPVVLVTWAVVYFIMSVTN